VTKPLVNTLQDNATDQLDTAGALPLTELKSMEPDESHPESAQ
jgi:hypothetical protein